MTRTERRGKYDRSQTPEQRTADRVEQLLDAATEVFAERGFAATRVEDIVERAGISRRTLYQHFDSVAAILSEVYERAVRTSFATVVERLMGVTDPIDRIYAGVAAYYEMIAEHPHAARVVFEVYRHAGPAEAAKYELNTTRYALLLLEFLNAAHAARRLARAPDETAVYALTKGLEAVGMRALARREHGGLPAIAPRMADLILDAFGATD
ncbi:MAG TPA: helix-turn-helix domain-containing protein [Kofleriaceae bacterium]|nr:helix-turn-helix domain-containing protein [Kofleriaceae bacterium]